MMAPTKTVSEILSRLREYFQGGNSVRNYRDEEPFLRTRRLRGQGGPREVRHLEDQEPLGQARYVKKMTVKRL